MIETILAGLAAIAGGYHLCALAAARRFFRRTPAGWPATAGAKAPAVSLIVPICGEESGLDQRIEALLSQDYPEYELIFAALDPRDPGLEPVRRAVSRTARARWRVVSGGPVHGPNRKVANLEQAYLRARHEVVAHIDSDMLAGPDYLRRLVAPLADPTVGVSFALYRGHAPATPGALLEGLSISTDFIPQVLVALALGEPDFGLGASIAMRRPLLQQLGGYRAFASYVNEDYQLVYRATHELRARAAASSAILDAEAGKLELRDHIAHRLRWARTVRAARPWGYAGTVFTNATLLGLTAALAAFAAGALPLGVAVLAGTLLVRIGVAAALAARLGDRWSVRFAFLAPMNDLVAAGTWVAAHFGRTVLWRGRRYRLGPGGAIDAPREEAAPERALTPEPQILERSRYSG